VRWAVSAVLVLTVAHTAAAERGPPARAGSLEVQSGTTGAEIFVDGHKLGEVPLDAPLPMTPGEHTIKVVKPGFVPYIDVFKTDRKKPNRLEVELVPVAGVLKLRTNVAAARVYVDGKFVGETPITTEMAVGARAVQVSKGGYQDFFQNLSSVAGLEINLDVQLDELPMGVNNPYKLAPPPPPKWFEKWWVWTVGAVAVGAVVTAVVVPAYYATRDPVGDFCRGNACAGGIGTVVLMPISK
jgi:PEGA domain-containing protein